MRLPISFRICWSRRIPAIRRLADDYLVALPVMVIVVSRELPLEEMKDIRPSTNPQAEVRRKAFAPMRTITRAETVVSAAGYRRPSFAVAPGQKSYVPFIFCRHLSFEWNSQKLFRAGVRILKLQRADAWPLTTCSVTPRAAAIGTITATVARACKSDGRSR